MAKKTIQELVYQELKRNIISLNLKPGMAMSTQEMATRLNVSRTPVREAFLQLQSENLVTMIPQKETIVSKINLTRIEQEKFIRESLELGVIDRFIKQKTDAYIQRMSDLIEQQKKYIQENDPVKFVEVDDKFHKTLFDATGQKMAWDTIEETNGHYNRYRILIVQNAEMARSSVEQHAEIVKLLAAGEEEQVRLALKSHIQRIDMDNTELISNFAEYFETGEEQRREIRIGSLS